VGRTSPRDSEPNGGVHESELTLLLLDGMVDIRLHGRESRDYDLIEYINDVGRDVESQAETKHR
jgi:hypothetical protein